MLHGYLMLVLLLLLRSYIGLVGMLSGGLLLLLLLLLL
jgi:hypothetical protein